jgi:predicted site-specific integrase-resolvase
MSMNLREWALSQGIHPQTAYRWYRQGKLPVPARKMGKLILVGDLEAAPKSSAGRSVIYARVSSADQQPDLDRQVARVTIWATQHGHSVDRIVTEVGSALNGHRRKLLALLRDRDVATIIVEHRDRCCRFGDEYIEAALEAQGRRLIAIDPSEVDDDLVGDATELLSSLCARLYDKRSAANRAKRAMEVACGEAVT